MVTCIMDTLIYASWRHASGIFTSCKRILDTSIMDTSIMDTCIMITSIMDTSIMDICIIGSCIIDICIIDSCIIWVEKEVLVNFAWVTRPERAKGAKDKVERPEGPPPRSRGPEGS